MQTKFTESAAQNAPPTSGGSKQPQPVGEAEVSKAPDTPHRAKPMLHLRGEEHTERPRKAVVGASANLLVIKVGTTSLMCDESPVPAFSLSNIGRLVDSVVKIHNMGYSVVLVTSGAVGAGCMHLKLDKKPSNMSGKQAAAAVGQGRLMRLYEDLFAIREEKVAQLLITRTDFSDKHRFLNFKNTLLELVHMGVIPILNENDSVACNQLKFGDNDTLAAYCAISLDAKWLFLLTDVDGLYTANPRSDPKAELIPYVGRLDDVYKLVGGDTMGTSWGSGGMRTKIIAAKLASATGIKTALCHGKYPERIIPIVKYYELVESMGDIRSPTNSQQDGKKPDDTPKLFTELPSRKFDAEFGVVPVTDAATVEAYVERGIGKGMEVGLVKFQAGKHLPYLGTVFAGHDVQQNILDQRRWILSLPVRGKLFLDCGAAQAVVNKKHSLFASGVVDAQGEFYEGEVVSIYLADEKMLDAKKNTEHSPDEAKSLKHHLKRPEPHMKRVISVPEVAALTFDGISEAEAESPEVARCLTNYSSDEVRLIKGMSSDKFMAVLGYCPHEEISNRANIIFINPTVVRPSPPVVRRKDSTVDDWKAVL